MHTGTIHKAKGRCQKCRENMEKLRKRQSEMLGKKGRYRICRLKAEKNGGGGGGESNVGERGTVRSGWG